jgi:hypothetical protein
MDEAEKIFYIDVDGQLWKKTYEYPSVNTVERVRTSPFSYVGYKPLELDDFFNRVSTDEYVQDLLKDILQKG